MGIVMRILQQFDPSHEDEFMLLESQFDALEKSRPNYPKGIRMQPISAAEPSNTLIWQFEFQNIEKAYEMLNFFSGDDGHEALFRQQVKFMKQVRIEFYKTLEFKEKS